MLIKKEQKLKDLYQKLLQDGYSAELLGQDGKPWYVAVPCDNRVVVIDYYSEPYYDVGEVGCKFGTTKYSLGFSYAFKEYTTGIIEKYVHEIEPNPELDLGGIEKYRELCALDNSDPDFFERFGDIYDEYAHAKDSDAYRKAFEQWKRENLTIITQDIEPILENKENCNGIME